jgi:hypothetical protein
MPSSKRMISGTSVGVSWDDSAFAAWAATRLESLGVNSQATLATKIDALTDAQVATLVRTFFKACLKVS